MVSDGMEFAVGDIERLFEEARRNTKTKPEKWEKYYNRRRRDVQIKVNDWVLVATHPLSSATRKVVAKFKPKFEDPYRELDVKNNIVMISKVGKRLTINVDQCVAKIKKQKPKGRDGNAHHKRLQSETKKREKRGVPTDHREEDTIRRTKSIQKRQRKER
ncbi:uncharacterized protein TNCV_505361 [Trichonephila clavipes]|nr:uncharacterized protein TNCV_505361 [Trichonephila clavipes]